MMRKIMAALDGSAPSEKCLPWARVLAGRRPVILIHVVDPIYGVDPKLFDIIAEGERYLERHARELNRGAKAIVRTGSVAPTILDAAKELGADLIALTTHGHSSMASLVFGSTVEKMMFNSDVPLLIVPSHPDVSSTAKVDRIVVPVDGSKVSEMIMPLAKALAREHRAELILVHAITTEADEKTGISAHLQQLTVELSEAGLCTKLVVTHGRPDEVVEAVVESEGADLVVLSAHGFGSMTRKLFGSTASRIVRTSPVPVIVARDKALRKLAKPVRHGRRARTLAHGKNRGKVVARRRR